MGLRDLFGGNDQKDKRPPEEDDQEGEQEETEETDDQDGEEPLVCEVCGASSDSVEFDYEDEDGNPALKEIEGVSVCSYECARTAWLASRQ